MCIAKRWRYFGTSNALAVASTLVPERMNVEDRDLYQTASTSEAAVCMVVVRLTMYKAHISDFEHMFIQHTILLCRFTALEDECFVTSRLRESL